MRLSSACARSSRFAHTLGSPDARSSSRLPTAARGFAPPVPRLFGERREIDRAGRRVDRAVARASASRSSTSAVRRSSSASAFCGLLAGRTALARDRLEPKPQAGERRSQLMRGVGDELALGLDAVLEVARPSG